MEANKISDQGNMGPVGSISTKKIDCLDENKSLKIEYDNVILKICEARADIQFNRPSKKNSMSPDLHNDMHRALDEIEKYERVKAIVISGVGNCFCSGMDLKKFFMEPLLESPLTAKKQFEIAGKWFDRLISSPSIVICRIHGFCFGGGVDLVGISDLAVAAEDAVLGLSEVNFGVLPAGGTTWAVKNNFNRKQGLRYCLTGETFNGKEAAEMGLVNIAVPMEKLDEEVNRLVENIVNKNALTLEAIKRVYNMLPTNWYEAVAFENASAQEMGFFQGENSWFRNALKKFANKEYKPGLGSYKIRSGE